MGFSKAYVHTKIWDSSGQHWPWRGHRALKSLQISLQGAVKFLSGCLCTMIHFVGLVNRVNKDNQEARFHLLGNH